MSTEQNLRRRKTDIMPTDNDHDLLVKLDTKVEVLIQQMAGFSAQVTSSNKELSDRVSRLEVKDSKDSGKFEAISADVQRSLGNHERINVLETKVDNLTEELNRIRSKANLFDSINAVGVVISGVIGFFFGNK